MNEQQFSKLMQHGRMKMPSSNFEERTMARIQREHKVKKTSSFYRKLSWIFFLLSAVLGALTIGFITTLTDWGSESLMLACQLGYVILLLAALNYLMQSKPVPPINDLP